MLHYSLLTLHLLSVLIWVGGMFFAWVVLRPVAASQLEPPARLTLWRSCFHTFFIWVWHAVVLLPLTGYAIIFTTYGGFANTPLFVHVMQLTGWLMVILYLYLWFKPYAALKRAVDSAQWPSGAIALASIRRIVGFNLLLGLLTTVLALMGRVFIT
ncbi:hypothetical protein D5085_08870 [Ectothiorhodospiraceae bacterium BW-2]|nr:hypothetical protein D5085_08870 [Ectothiorhodospiraceae bacterium BW-2]